MVSPPCPRSGPGCSSLLSPSSSSSLSVVVGPLLPRVSSCGPVVGVAPAPPRSSLAAPLGGRRRGSGSRRGGRGGRAPAYVCRPYENRRGGCGLSPRRESSRRDRLLSSRRLATCPAPAVVAPRPAVVDPAAVSRRERDLSSRRERLRSWRPLGLSLLGCRPLLSPRRLRHGRRTCWSL